MKTINELILKLQQDGVSEEEISVILGEISKASSVKLLSQMISALTEDQKMQIEDAETEDEAKELMNSMYEYHYGMTTDSAIEELQSQFVEAYLKSQS